MSHKDDCLFCKIIQGKIPSQKVFENESVFIFKDIQPQASTHLLVIPKIHIESLAQLSASELSILTGMYAAALTVAETLQFKDLGFRTVINTGEQGGQTVFHLHMHILTGTQLSGKFN